MQVKLSKQTKLFKKIENMSMKKWHGLIDKYIREEYMKKTHNMEVRHYVRIKSDKGAKNLIIDGQKADVESFMKELKEI